ncbi:MAG: inositol monophosphatase [Actinobacteria bacterium]|nr:inositol monophosphatase [Actinomycetota bacterium]
MTGPDSAELLGLAVNAAQAAAAMLAAGRPAGPSGRPEVTDTKSSPTDVVTDMDREAEALIRRRLLAARPQDAILGEEGGEKAGPDGPGRVRWVVDPLDGTVNYLYGLPDWSVSIAAEVDGTVVAGVVTVPARGEVFTATLGGGAWLDATIPLRCNTGVPLEQALVSTGFGYEVPRRVVQGKVVGAVLPRVRDIRRGGSCAVDLCSLAAGRVDAYYERGVNYWDWAAGGLVATEAGALLGGLARAEASPSMAIAAEPVLFGQLRDLLASLDAERDG